MTLYNTCPDLIIALMINYHLGGYFDDENNALWTVYGRSLRMKLLEA